MRDGVPTAPGPGQRPALANKDQLSQEVGTFRLEEPGTHLGAHPCGPGASPEEKASSCHKGRRPPTTLLD